MKRLILVRHGETFQDKTDPERVLTVKGIENTIKLGRILKGLVSGKVVILCTNKKRAVESAKIIAKELGTGDIETADLRIQNLELLKDLIEKNEKEGIRPARTFLSLAKDQLGNVESREDFANRLAKIFDLRKEKTIIAVSHEASLEAFLYGQKKFGVVKKSFKKYFDYSDFALLVKA